MINFLDVPVNTVLYIPFESFAGSTGAPTTITGFSVGDIKIFKNGLITERASTSGFALLDTDGIDFDGITGLNGFSIDLSDNADVGFYAAGNRYWVIISVITVDGQTMSFIAATFSIEIAGGAIALLKNLLKIVKNKKTLSKTGSVWSLNIFDDNGSTPIVTKALKDKDGNDITDLAAGILAQELASSV